LDNCPNWLNSGYYLPTQSLFIDSDVFAAPLDAASETSSKDDRSKTEASSIDLEWEHEAGMYVCY